MSLSIISVGVHHSLLDGVHIIVDVSSRVGVPQNLSDGWIIDILHRHRHVCLRRTNTGDIGAGGRLLGSDPGQSNCQPWTQYRRDICSFINDQQLNLAQSEWLG